MKKKALKIFIILILVVGIVYGGIYAYWGRQHKVLYDVENVNITVCDDGSYDYEIIGTVRNWPHNFLGKKEYYLKYCVEGAPDYICVNEPAKVSVSGLNDSDFTIKGKFTPSSAERIVFQEEFLNVRFAAEDADGKYIEDGYDLFMSDNKKTDISYYE